MPEEKKLETVSSRFIKYFKWISAAFNAIFMRKSELNDIITDFFEGDEVSNNVILSASAAKVMFDQISDINVQLGDADISEIGDGTVKGAIYELNEDLEGLSEQVTQDVAGQLSSLSSDVDVKIGAVNTRVGTVENNIGNLNDTTDKTSNTVAAKINKLSSDLVNNVYSQIKSSSTAFIQTQKDGVTRRLQLEESSNDINLWTDNGTDNWSVIDTLATKSELSIKKEIDYEASTYKVLLYTYGKMAYFYLFAKSQFTVTAWSQELVNLSHTLPYEVYIRPQNNNSDTNLVLRAYGSVNASGATIANGTVYCATFMIN